MGKGTRGLSRQIGLEVGSILGKYFLQLDHLHYGLWPAGEKPAITGVAAAQRRYTEMLISQIPDAVKTILDVGCGSGQTARDLIALGYRVDCLSPSPYLSGKVRESLGDGAAVFECRYEDLETEKRYDMIMFSESFQYVDMERAISRSVQYLNDSGCILVSDVFKRSAGKKGGLGGGHHLEKFHRIISAYPFELVRELDITDQAAPNIDLLDDVMQNAVLPAVNSSLRLLEDRHPFLARLITWKYGRKLGEIRTKHFDSGRTADNFRKHKAYMVFLYRKRPSRAMETRPIAMPDPATS
jgi:SAM-dependent methyltransferase